MLRFVELLTGHVPIGTFVVLKRLKRRHGRMDTRLLASPKVPNLRIYSLPLAAYSSNRCILKGGKES